MQQEYAWTGKPPSPSCFHFVICLILLYSIFLKSSNALNRPKNVRHDLNVSSEFQQIIFIQAILEEGEDSFQRITCFNSRLLLELNRVRNILNYIVGEVLSVGSISLAFLSCLVTGIEPRSLQAA